jgi:hypothetical protein
MSTKATFTLIVPKSRDPKEGNFEIGLKDIDETTYLAALSYINAGKVLEACRFIVKELRVSGDSSDDFSKSFLSVNAAQDKIAELITPLQGELKKN